MSIRYHSIDAIRGFCLINIYVNHLTTSMVKEASPSKLGFSDSAEIFVLLAGISVFLAYAPNPRAKSVTAMCVRVWRRAVRLYVVNLIVIASTALFALAMWDRVQVLPAEIVQVLNSDLAYTLPTLLTMQQSIGFSMVLRLYVLLMLVAPLYLWLASKRYWYPLVPAVAVWFVAGVFELVEAEAITGTPLALTFLPWNLVFAFGISVGAGIKQGVSLPTAGSFRLMALSVLVVSALFITVATRFSTPAFEWTLSRNDAFLTGASKTFQSPLRVVHVFALWYVVTACRDWPVIRLFHAARPDGVLCKLGRNSLAVFATGAVLAVVGDTLLANFGVPNGGYSLAACALEAMVVVVGFGAMYAAAELGEMRRRSLGSAVALLAKER